MCSTNTRPNPRRRRRRRPRPQGLDQTRPDQTRPPDKEINGRGDFAQRKNAKLSLRVKLFLAIFSQLPLDVREAKRGFQDGSQSADKIDGQINCFDSAVHAHAQVHRCGRDDGAMGRPPPGQKALDGARSGSFLSPYVMRFILMTLGVMSPNLVLSLESSGSRLQYPVLARA
ncbi:hypothetical protein M5D96_006827 [Drosophila gunungcola]|uniref:Uncharacterized protein n=1 Tax=Drosophila gunungcola TaxID=103775 RepID=A0A9P9YPR3_9MUSC|nr:hypothetical protein M5D96_006827 [Drosophila gunungcola]